MSTRREFLSAPAAGLALGARPAAAAALRDVEHVKLHGERNTYCGHPRQGGLFYFGRGELAVLHNHAYCAYETRRDVQHDFGGYHSRAVVLLQRSTDFGRTWPGENEVEVWNEAAPIEERMRFLLSAFSSPREEIDLADPNAIVVFPRTFLGAFRYGTSHLVGFALRSRDKGRTWERVPTLLLPPPGCFSACPDSVPVVRLPDRTLLLPVRTSGGRRSLDLYVSTDSGLSWQYRRQVCQPGGYPAFVLLPGGRLLCCHYPLGTCYSDDGGKTWSEARTITPASPSPWLPDDPFYGEELAHRSPMPLVLRDGRIVILFARRVSASRGIGLIVSEDGGKTWGPDLILRSDAAASSTTRVSTGATCEYSDIGYPLAAQLEDGRVFTAYYYISDNVKPLGGPRYIAGSFFRVS